MRIVTDTVLVKYSDTKYDILVLNKTIEDNYKSIDKKGTNTYNLSNYYRIKRKVRELAFCNNFDFFVTLTISPNLCDRSSLPDILFYIRKHLKKYKRKNSDFSYLLIPELHKDKKNYHFHGLMRGINPSDIYTNRNGFSSCSFFDYIGYNSFEPIKSYERCCTYITKYVTKGLVKAYKGHSYIHSRGLKFAERYRVKNFDISYLKKYGYFENDFMKKISLSNIDNMDKKDLFNLINKLNESEELYKWNKTNDIF